MNRELIEGRPWKAILRFALPVFIGLLLQQLYNTVDTIVVGNFESQDALSAVGATTMLTMAFLAIANGFSAGAGVIIAQLFGADKKEKLRRTASTQIILLLVMGLAATALALVISKPMLQGFLDTPEDILEMSLLYFRIYALGLIFQFAYNVVAAILRGVGDSKATMYFLFVAALINIVLDVVLVAKFHMGVAGAAIATNVAQAGCALAGAVYMVKKYPIFRWKLREMTFEMKVAAETLRIGFPMALQQLIASAGFMFLQRAVNGYGKFMTASFTVANRVEMYLNLPCVSLQVTQATYTGQNMGAGRLDRVKLGAFQTIVISELITFCISMLVRFNASSIISLFGISGQAADYCMQHIMLTSLTLFIFAVYFPILGLFQGAGDGFKATIVATVALFFRVLSTYTLCHIPAIGYKIVWYNCLFGFGIGLTITAVFYFRGGWQKKRMAG